MWLASAFGLPEEHMLLLDLIVIKVFFGLFQIKDSVLWLIISESASEVLLK